MIFEQVFVVRFDIGVIRIIMVGDTSSSVSFGIVECMGDESVVVPESGSTVGLEGER